MKELLFNLIILQFFLRGLLQTLITKFTSFHANVNKIQPKACIKMFNLKSYKIFMALLDIRHSVLNMLVVLDFDTFEIT